MLVDSGRPQLVAYYCVDNEELHLHDDRSTKYNSEQQSKRLQLCFRGACYTPYNRYEGHDILTTSTTGQWSLHPTVSSCRM
jgi:hypothetical protein